MELHRIDPEELDLSLGRLRQVPEPAVRSMTMSLRQSGQLSPLVAATVGDALVLVDGFVRHAAARRLDLSSVFVEVVELSPTQMKAQVYLRNRERGLLLVEECRLVQELHDTDGLTQVQIADLLERHKTWVCRRLSLQRALSPHLLEDMALGLWGPGVLRRLALLPARNQEELAAVARREGLSATDTSGLIDLWRRTTDAEARAYLLDHPRDALGRLRGHHEEKVDPRWSDSTRTLLTAVSALSVASLRLEQAIEKAQGHQQAEAFALITTRRGEAEARSRRALETLDRWIDQAKEEADDQQER